MATVIVSRSTTARDLRRVLLDGAEIGGCSISSKRHSGGTEVRFYPGGRMGKDVEPWRFSTLDDLRARLPSVWLDANPVPSAPVDA